MENAVIKFDIPAEILYTLNKNGEEFVKDIKHIVSVEMYRKGVLSLENVPNWQDYQKAILSGF